MPTGPPFKRHEQHGWRAGTLSADPAEPATERRGFACRTEKLVRIREASENQSSTVRGCKQPQVACQKCLGVVATDSEACISG